MQALTFLESKEINGESNERMIDINQQSLLKQFIQRAAQPDGGNAKK